MAAVLKFFSLRDLHDSANALLRSPGGLKCALSNIQQHQNCLQIVSESLLKILWEDQRHTPCQDSHPRAPSRITLGETSASVGKNFSAYHLHRKDLKKQMLKRLKSLKMTTKKNTTTTTTAGCSENNHNLSVVGNVLDEVRGTISSLVESLMFLMSMPSPNNYHNPAAAATARKSSILNISNGGRLVVAKVKFMRLNSLSPWEKCDVHAVRQGIERLEAVESVVEDLEVELECIFKRLIRTRIFSQIN